MGKLGLKDTKVYNWNLADVAGVFLAPFKCFFEDNRWWGYVSSGSCVLCVSYMHVWSLVNCFISSASHVHVRKGILEGGFEHHSCNQPVLPVCRCPPPPAFLDLECLEAAKANQNQSWLVLRLEVLNFCIFVYSKHPRSRVYWPSTNKREHYEVCTMRNTKTNINLHYPLDLLRNMEEQFNTQDPTRVLLVTTWCTRWYLQCNTIQLNEFWNSGIASV